MKLSRQTWNLCAKIKQLDQLISHVGSQMGFLEAHPELVFCLLKGSPMQFSKQPQEGRKQRIELLDSAELPVTALLDQQAGPYRRSQVAVGDLLDAAVLFALSLFEPIPLLAHTVVDEFGIYSNMIAPAGRL
jgi:predicted RNase H-like nuclease